MKTIFVDVDQVVADLMPAWLKLYNDEWGDTLTPEDIRSWDLKSYVKPECGGRIYRYLEEPTLYDSVYPIEGALEGVEMLRVLGYHVVFLTAAGPEGARGKLRWLKDWRFLPAKGSGHPWQDVVITASKYLVSGLAMIDDYVENLRTAKIPLPVLFDQPHNQDVEWGHARVRNWSDLTNRMPHADSEMFLLEVASQLDTYPPLPVAPSR